MLDQAGLFVAAMILRSDPQVGGMARQHFADLKFLWKLS